MGERSGVSIGQRVKSEGREVVDVGQAMREYRFLWPWTHLKRPEVPSPILSISTLRLLTPFTRHSLPGLSCLVSIESLRVRFGFLGTNERDDGRMATAGSGLWLNLNPAKSDG
jgi:hypothetical protein